MNDMVVYNLTRELDSQAIQIAQMQKQINSVKKVAGFAVGAALVGIVISAINMVEISLFEDRYNNEPNI